MGRITEQTGYGNCFVDGAATELHRKQICTFPVLTISESRHT